MREQEWNPPAGSYADWAHRFHKAELLPSGAQGVIFIGNTRAGKSTLACTAAGAQLAIDYDRQARQAFLSPRGPRFAGKVRNDMTSVTEVPNFFPPSGTSRHAIVDLPGNADNDAMRELVNFHYIETMARNLEMVSFMVVLTVKENQQEGGLFLEQKEKDMLASFARTFAGLDRNCIRLVLNRVDSALFKKDEDLLTAFRTMMAEASRTSHEIAKYFMFLNNSSIHVVRRPPFQPTRNQQTEREERKLGERIRSFVDQLGEDCFCHLRIGQFSSFRLLREDAQTQRQVGRMLGARYGLLKKETEEGYFQQVSRHITGAVEVLKQCVGWLLGQAMGQHSVASIEPRIISCLQQHDPLPPTQDVFRLPEPSPKTMLDSVLLALLCQIQQSQRHFEGDISQKYSEWEDIINGTLDSLSALLSQAVLIASHKPSPAIKELHRFLRRCYQKYFFLVRVFVFDLQEGKAEDVKEFSSLGWPVRELKFENLPFNNEQVHQFLGKALELDTNKLFSAEELGKRDPTALKQQLRDNYSLVEQIVKGLYKDLKEDSAPYLEKIRHNTVQIDLAIALNTPASETTSKEAIVRQLFEVEDTLPPQDPSRLRVAARLASLLSQLDCHPEAAKLYLVLNLPSTAMDALSRVHHPSLPQLEKTAQALRKSMAFEQAVGCWELCKLVAIQTRPNFIEYCRQVDLKLFDLRSPERRSQLLKEGRVWLEQGQGGFDWSEVDQFFKETRSSLRHLLEGGRPSRRTSLRRR